jgi:hypothetical protein
MVEYKTNLIFNNFLQSKYTFKSLLNYPKIKRLDFNIIIVYKQKNKYYLFINIILLLLFFNTNLKTQFFFKISSINILKLTLRGQNSILRFLSTFIYIYFPLIDSFSAELKFFPKKNIVTFCFFKFPLLFELNILFISLEYLYTFLNNYKFQLSFHFKKKKNYLSNYNLLQMFKFPLQLVK